MEAIKLETCSHERLLELDQTQGYTAVANNVMLHIISNPIVAPASRLWILIRFQQSGFYDREYIDRTVGWFAKKLNVSSSTIQRWQRLLEREGYLEIVERKYSAKNNRPNRYRACLPKCVADALNVEEKVYTKYTSEDQPPLPNEVDLDLASDVSTVVDDETKKALFALFSDAPDWLTQLLPGLSFDVEKGTLWVCGVHAHAQTFFKSAQNDVIVLLRSLGFEVERIAFNRQAPVSKEPAVSTSETEDSTTPLYSHTRHRIYKRLLGLSINGARLQVCEAKRLCAEVIYAVEQGCFAQHPTLLGINIALKLIRENRWRTPSGYPQMGSQQ